MIEIAISIAFRNWKFVRSLDLIATPYLIVFSGSEFDREYSAAKAEVAARREKQRIARSNRQKALEEATLREMSLLQELEKLVISMPFTFTVWST